MKNSIAKHHDGRRSVDSKKATRGSVGPAQAEPRACRKRGKKKKAKPSSTQGSNCGYHELLSLMPPLRHEPKNAEFDIKDSDVCRFILLAMGLNQMDPRSWEAAQDAFWEALTNQILIVNHGSAAWHGRYYRPTKPGTKANWSRRIRQIMSTIGKAQHRRWKATGEGKNQPTTTPKEYDEK